MAGVKFPNVRDIQEAYNLWSPTKEKPKAERIHRKIRYHREGDVKRDMVIFLIRKEFKRPKAKELHQLPTFLHIPEDLTHFDHLMDGLTNKSAAVKKIIEEMIITAKSGVCKIVDEIEGFIQSQDWPIISTCIFPKKVRVVV